MAVARSGGDGIGEGRQEAAALPEALRREFSELGLSPYESRILLALLRLGSANTLHLAKVAEVPRTSTYQVLEELRGKGLALQIPGEGPAVWAAPGRDEVMDRLDAAEEERLAEHKARTLRIRELMAESLPENPSVALPYVHMLASAAQMKAAYEQLLREATSEFVMFTRPPYTWVMGNPNPVVVETLGRGVRSQVLYQETEWADPAAGAFRAEMEVYHRAGVEARVVEDLPIKLVVVDHKVALVAMTDPVGHDVGYPTTLLIEHPGFAAVAADAFEQRWATGRPLPPAPERGEDYSPEDTTDSSAVLATAPKMGGRPDGRLTSAEAAAYLAINRTTLYAYVSRGLLHSERQSDGSMSTFDAEEVARFAANRGKRRSDGP